MAEDLITRYQLDISDLKLQVANLETQFKKLTDAEKKSAKDGEDAFKKTGNEVEKTSEKTSDFTKKLDSLATSIAAAFAVERIIAFGVESVKAFGEAERNALKLQTAVGVNGGLEKNFQALLNQSAQLQKTTIFSDDAIQAVQTAALQFGLTSSEVENLIPILTDFASATGQDLNSALSVIISGVNGATRGLKQYGITIGDNLTKQEKFNEILQQANDKFKGQGELIAGTTLGSVSKLSNAWGDFQESVGAFISQDGKLAEVLGVFTKIINAGFDVGKAKALELLPQRIETLQPEVEKLYNKINKGAEDLLANAGEGLGRKNEKALEIINSTIESQQKKIADIEKAGKGPLVASLAYLEIFKQVKAKIEAEGAPKIEIPDDYRKATKEQLEQLAKDNNAFAIDELDRRKEVEKKKIEASKKTAEEQKKNLEALQKFSDDANKQSLISTAETEVEKLRIQKEAALKQAKQLFDAAGGAKSTEAVKAYNQAVLAIETDYAERIKQARLKTIQTTFDEQKKLNQQNADEDLKNTISNIESNQDAQILALKQAYVDKGDFSKAAEKKLQDDITAIQLDAERKRIEESYKFKAQQIENLKNLEVQAAIQRAVVDDGAVGLQLLNNKKLAEAIQTSNANANNAKIENDKAYADALQKLGLKIVDGQIKVSNTTTENWVASNADKIQAAQQAADEIINTFNAILESQITNKENELKALQDSYDAEDEELQYRLDKRLIGAGDFEKQQAIIKQQRITNEKKIQDEINKLKHQEDVANRAKAIFDIVLNTAVAISKLLATPFLAVMAGVLGAAQLTAVLSTPLPKYAEGTKYLERGNNPHGVDTIPILANEGERIVPTDINKKYWSIYEAIDDGTFNDFVNQKFVAPALVKQMKEQKKIESYSFAENVANSFMLNHDLLATKIGAEIEWRQSSGIKVKGMDKLIESFETKTDLRKR